MKLYMIPGAGTDERMYAPQCDSISELIPVPWLPPLSLTEPIESYARRLAQTIDQTSPYALGGVSLGGMIAQEMAQILNPTALILIASCHTSMALPITHRLAGRLERWLPDWYNKSVLWVLSRIVLLVRNPYSRIISQMLATMPPRLVRWQEGAAVTWAGNLSFTIPVFHLHGTRDLIIPCKNVCPTETIKGGHLISGRQYKQVNAFILRALKSLENKSIKPL